MRNILTALLLLCCPLPALAAPFTLIPAAFGRIFAGDNDPDNTPDLSAGVGVNLVPNWQTASNLGQGVASALNGTVQSIADGHRAVDRAVIGSVANAAVSGLDVISNSGGALGSAVAGLIGALGNGATAVGSSLGPLNAGLSADAEVELKNAFEKFVGAVISATANPQNAPAVLVALRDLIKVTIENGIAANLNAFAGPIGSINVGAQVKEALNLITHGLLGGMVRG